MMKQLILYFIFLLFVNQLLLPQHGDPSLLRTGYLYGNNIKIYFSNDGGLGTVSQQGYYGTWKGTTYIANSTFVLGLELPLKDYTGDGTIDTVHSVIIPRNPRNRAAEERDTVDGHFWGFNPIPGYVNPSKDSAATSLNSSSWPNTWADHPEWGSNVWYGLNGPDNFTGQLEGFFKIDDFNDNEVQQKYNYFPNPSDTTITGHGIEISVRYIQFDDSLFNDVLFTFYDIKNISEQVYEKVFFWKASGAAIRRLWGFRR